MATKRNARSKRATKAPTAAAKHMTAVELIRSLPAARIAALTSYAVGVRHTVRRQMTEGELVMVSRDDLFRVDAVIGLLVAVAEAHAPKALPIDQNDATRPKRRVPLCTCPICS